MGVTHCRLKELFHHYTLMVQTSAHWWTRPSALDICLLTDKMIFLLFSCPTWKKAMYWIFSLIFNSYLPRKVVMMSNPPTIYYVLHCLNKHEMNNQTFLVQVFKSSWIMCEVTVWQCLCLQWFTVRAECRFEDILSQIQHQLDSFHKAPLLLRKENYSCQNLSCNLNYHYKWNAGVKDIFFFRQQVQPRISMEKETINWYCQIPWHVWYSWYCVFSSLPCMFISLLSLGGHSD